MAMSRSRIASPTGKCHTFSSDADGYVRGEGCGIVILKRLQDAKRDGNKVLATVFSGCNQDGRTTTPITAPSGEQQSALLQQVYKRFNVDPSAVQYIEAHGTGTPRGDPTEVDSLGQHFSASSRETDTCIGSVKTNIGHLEAASGVAGFIKVLLMMKHATIAPNLHYHPPNPKLRFADYKLRVPKICEEWQPDKFGRRTACANSFGFGGTNAHAILQQSFVEKQQFQSENNCSHLVAISAHSKSTLRLCLDKFLEEIHVGDYNIDDVSFTSLRKRDHHPYRLSFVAKSLNGIDGEKLMSKVNNAQHSESKTNQVIFVFCGVGTCWKGMCKRLVSRFSVFREKLLDIDHHLQAYCDVSLLELFENESDFDDPFLSHLSIFASQVCLAALWEYWGIVPSCVVGQSVGEVAASVISGALSLKDGVAVIYYRSKFLSEMSGGRMIVCLGVATSTVEDICEDTGDVSVAVYISPQASTVSGSADGIEKFKKTIAEKLKFNGLRLHNLHVSCAYHSRHVSEAAQNLLNSLKNLQTNKARIPVYSTVTGSVMSEPMTPEYWFRNVIEPVKFQQAIENASQNSTRNVFIEIGPSPVLSAHLSDILPTSSPISLPSVVRHRDDDQLLETLGTLYEMGFQLNWDNMPCSGEVTDIPKTVPERHTLLKFPSISMKRRSTAEIFKLSHMFVTETADNNVYEIQISPDTVPFAYEHNVLDHLVLPAATYIETCLAIGKLHYNSYYRCNMKFDRFLFMEKEDTLLVTLGTTMDSGHTIQIEKEGTLYAQGHILPSGTPKSVIYDIEKIRSFCTRRVEKSEIYSVLKQAGFSYGPNLQLLQYGLAGENVSFAEIILNEHVISNLGNTSVHPCVLDACLQATVLSSHHTGNWKRGVPYSLGSIQQVSAITDKMYIISYVTEVSETRIKHDISLLNDKGGLVVEIKDFMTKRTGDQAMAANYKYSVEWKKLSVTQSYERNEEVTANQQINLVILTFSDKIVDMYKTSKSQCAVVFKMQSLIDSNGKTFFFEKFIKTLTDKLQSVNCVQVIVYQPGIILDSPFSTTEDVFDKVLQQCYSFVLLVRALKTHKIHIPIVTMTENGVTLSSSEICNPIAASLWGLCRCIMIEIGASNMALLLDVCSEYDYAESCKLDFPKFFKNGLVECAIRKNILYTNHLTAVDSDECPTSREITRDSLSQAELKSARSDGLEDPYLLYKHPVLESLPADGFVRIFVKTVCLHNPILFPTVETSVFEVPAPNKPHHDKGRSVLTFEVVGNVLSTTNENVVACYPLIAGCYVDVPQECIIQIEPATWYKPGMLTKMVLILDLIDHIQKKANVTVLLDECDSYTEAFINLLLHVRHISNYNIASVRDLTSGSRSIYSTLLCLVPLTKSLCMLLQQQWRTPEQLVSLNSLIDGSNVLMLSKTHHAFDIVSQSLDNVLSLQCFKHSVPIIKQTINKCFAGNWKNNDSNSSLTEQSSDKTDIGVLSPTRALHFEQSLGNAKYVAAIPVRTEKERLFRKDACYIVVGGMSGLGWEVMCILAKMGAGYIVSMSRRIINNTHREMLARMAKNHNCFMTALSADVNDLDSIYELIHTISETLPSVPIKGVFHGAAVEADEHMFTISRETFEKGLRPKVQGTWNLHIATRHLPLDYFIIHSSVTALLGNLTQTNYGAGCAFQNGFIHFRRHMGFCGQSINWGGLAVGLAVGDETKAGVLKDNGIILLEIDDVEKCLIDTLMHDHKEIAYCGIDWKVCFRQQNKNSGIPWQRFQKLVKNPQGDKKKAHIHFKGETDGESIPSLTNEVTDILAQSVSIDIEVLKPETHLIDLGIDSMTSLALIGELKAKLNVVVPLVLILAPTATISSLATYIGENQKGNSPSVGTDDSGDSFSTQSLFS